jgi:hypothetical protein
MEGPFSRGCLFVHVGYGTITAQLGGETGIVQNLSWGALRLQCSTSSAYCSSRAWKRGWSLIDWSEILDGESSSVAELFEHPWCERVSPRMKGINPVLGF